MSTLAFDTHSFVKRLTEAGMPEPQAEVLSSEQARLLEYQLATKQDTAEIKRDIEALRAETKQDIAEIKRDIEALRAETKQDIAEIKRDIEALRAETEQDIAEIKRDIEALRAETKQDIAELKRDIAEIRQDIAGSKVEIVKWMFAALLGQAALITALLKLLV